MSNHTIKDGYVYCEYFIHYRTGKKVYPKTAKCFKFKIGK
jgi:hypothetical protein